MKSKNDILKALAFLVDGYIDFREGLLERKTTIPDVIYESPCIIRR